MCPSPTNLCKEVAGHGEVAFLHCAVESSLAGLGVLHVHIHMAVDQQLDTVLMAALHSCMEGGEAWGGGEGKREDGVERDF